MPSLRFNSVDGIPTSTVSATTSKWEILFASEPLAALTYLLEYQSLLSTQVDSKQEEVVQSHLAT